VGFFGEWLIEKSSGEQSGIYDRLYEEAEEGKSGNFLGGEVGLGCVLISFFSFVFVW